MERKEYTTTQLRSCDTLQLFVCIDHEAKGEMNRMPSESERRSARWPLERALFALAGSMTLLSALLVVLVSPWFALLTAFVGVNQWLYVVVGACPASMILRRAFSLRSAMPWVTR
jgi:Flp pilus assembly protein TadB